MANVKISELPADTALSDTAKIPVVDGGVTAAITYANLKTGLDYQPGSTNLDTYSDIEPSNVGQNMLVKENPVGVSYIRVSNLGVLVYMTPEQVLADVDAQPQSANLDELSTLNSTLVGQNLLTLDPPAVAHPFYFIRIGSGLDNDVFYRTPAQVLTDIGGFATANLDTSTDLDGGLASNSKAASQLATKKYVDARIGAPTLGDSDDTIASAATLDLDSTIGTQVDVTGTNTITLITLAEGDEKVIVFTGILSLTNSGDLQLPGGEDITTTVGAFATVIGKADDVVIMSSYSLPNSGGQKANFVGGSITQLETFGIRPPGMDHDVLITHTDSGSTADRTLSFDLLDGDRHIELGGNVAIGSGMFINNGLTLDGELTTIGAFDTTLNITATTNSTLPAGTHTLHARDSYATTATAAGTTTLTVASKYQQFFTGATTQTVTLPVASTLTLGFTFRIVNLSSGNVTVQSSGGNSVVVLSANTAAILTCILNSGTSAASWSAI